jgi:hypothetical protein
MLLGILGEGGNIVTEAVEDEVLLFATCDGAESLDSLLERMLIGISSLFSDFFTILC